ncbi:MAG: FHA domain-containing protein [Planctomycetota bacterium]|nr:FHA domain-containing protein [Planctomycetota bacterium]
MPMKLTLSLGGRTLERYEFDKPLIRVGRNEDCDVPIDNLGISRYHAEIIHKDGFYLLRDLQSNNGTFVNGRRITTHALNDGDEVSIGKFSLVFTGNSIDLSEHEKPDDKDEDDDFGGMTMQMDQQALAQLQREKASRIRGYLVVERNGKKENLFLEKACFIFGKFEDADINVTGWFTPRKLAVILRDESGFRLMNVSHKGKDTWVNGKQVDDVRLADNDEIVIKDIKMRFMRGSPVR